MAKSKVTKEWFKFAVRDLKTGQALFNLGPNHKYVIVFLAQQCVEKAMKGYLVHLGERPPKTHELHLLVDMIVRLNPKIKRQISQAKSLSKYAVIYRYPDAEKRPLTFATAKTAIDKAKKIYDLLLGNVQEP